MGFLANRYGQSRIMLTATASTWKKHPGNSVSKALLVFKFKPVKVLFVNKKDNQIGYKIAFLETSLENWNSKGQ